ncbi:histidine kinase N-terminal 7TM domain-containing protein [Thalassovita sp.]|uniref:histidine kinase N-terminal 7TM domain-containing protein n=1 Tax=Thalassovita sp. TaxID=1979401 RepID=UPI0029DE84AC|nr:histidine kinase N-terminal 7TM domain-containing protein [Thalassovita sp.]
MTCLAPDLIDFPVLGTISVFLGTLLFALWVWRNHQFAGKREFMAAEIGMLWWLFAASMELSNESMDCKMLWSQLAWPGIILMPSAWAMFLFHYALGQDDSLPQLKFFSIWVGPTLISAVALTNGLHHLMYTENTRLIVVNGRLSGAYDHGPLFYMAVSYVYAFMLASLGIVVASVRRARPQLRPFFVMMLVITAVPIVANLTYVLWGITLFGFDPTPFMFAFVILALGWMVANNRMMDITAIARDLLFDDTTSPILIFDDEGRLSGSNQAAGRILRQQDLAIGTMLTEVPQVKETVQEVLRHHKLPAQSLVICNDHSFDPRLTPLPSPINPDGPPMGWTIAFVDVTEQQAQADLMARAARKAEAANIAKSDFLSTVSHELRTPLTSIQGALDIFRMTAGDSVPTQSAQLIEIAANNTRRLKTLIDDLLDLQRMEQGLMEFQMEPLDLVPMVRESIMANQGYLDGFGIQAEADLPGAPCSVLGDQKRLMQVMANLLSNAAKFSDHGKTVKIALRQQKGQFAIMVRDFGVGIPPGCEDKVFGRFSQVDSAATRSRGGSGLGLNITQEILEAHHGSIRYESALGQGTTFIVTLPAA